MPSRPGRTDNDSARRSARSFRGAGKLPSRASGRHLHGQPACYVDDLRRRTACRPAISSAGFAAAESGKGLRAWLARRITQRRRSSPAWVIPQPLKTQSLDLLVREHRCRGGAPLGQRAISAASPSASTRMVCAPRCRPPAFTGARNARGGDAGRACNPTTPPLLAGRRRSLCARKSGARAGSPHELLRAGHCVASTLNGAAGLDLRTACDRRPPPRATSDASSCANARSDGRGRSSADLVEGRRLRAHRRESRPGRRARVCRAKATPASRDAVSPPLAEASQRSGVQTEPTRRGLTLQALGQRTRITVSALYGGMRCSGTRDQAERSKAAAAKR